MTLHHHRLDTNESDDEFSSSRPVPAPAAFLIPWTVNLNMSPLIDRKPTGH